MRILQFLLPDLPAVSLQSTQNTLVDPSGTRASLRFTLCNCPLQLPWSIHQGIENHARRVPD